MRWGIEGLLLVLVLLLISVWQTRGHARGPAPSFSLPHLDGSGVVTNASLREKRTLVVFWAPWCGVCRVESRNVSWVQSLVGDHARVLSIASEYAELTDVERYVEEQAVDYPVLLGGRAAAARFGVSAYPTAFVLDENGEIAHSMVGYTTTFGLLWRLLL